MTRLVLSCAVTLAASISPASAETALIDGVETYGGVTPEAASAHLSRALVAAGYTVYPGEPGATSCGADLACARRRIRAAGVDVAVRAAYVELAGQISVSLQLVGPVAEPREVSATIDDLEALEPDFVGALRSPFREPAPGGSRRAAWWLAGAGAALVIGGGAALLVARAQRDRFFADFVDEGGDVSGITPAEARRRQDRANRWLGAGYLLAGAGVLAGATSVVLFATGRPGVAVQGEF